MTNHKS